MNGIDILDERAVMELIKNKDANYTTKSEYRSYYNTICFLFYESSEFRKNYFALLKEIEEFRGFDKNKSGILVVG